MKKQNIWLVVFAVCVMCGSQIAGDGNKGGSPDGTADVIFARSDLFGAFVVAYEQQQKRWRGLGVELTPQEFVKRHWAVHCAREGSDRFAVTFTPASPLISDGAVIHMVDRHSLKVVETKLDR